MYPSTHSAVNLCCTTALFTGRPASAQLSGYCLDCMTVGSHCQSTSESILGKPCTALLLHLLLSAAVSCRRPWPYLRSPSQAASSCHRMRMHMQAYMCTDTRVSDAQCSTRRQLVQRCATHGLVHELPGDLQRIWGQSGGEHADLQTGRQGNMSVPVPRGRMDVDLRSDTHAFRAAWVASQRVRAPCTLGTSEEEHHCC